MSPETLEFVDVLLNLARPAKRGVKLEDGAILYDCPRSRGHAEFDVAVSGSNPDQRIEKRIRTHDVPAGPMLLSQHRLREARVEMGLRTLDLEADRFLHDPTH